MITLAFYLGRAEDNPRAQLGDHIVTAFDRGPYSHVEIVDHRTRVGWSSSARDGGVRAKVIDWDSGSWHFMDVEGDLDEALRLVAPCVGFPYDWFGLLFFVVPFRLEERAKMFCSEVVAYGLELDDPWSYSPNDLAHWVQMYFPQSVRSRLTGL